jgi:dTDP-L-rhamnose 4-epimerase
VANHVNAYFGVRSKVEIAGTFRDGDIRHGIADLAQAKRVLGYEPRWRSVAGLKTFLDRSRNFTPDIAGYEQSLSELKNTGLLHEKY